MEEDIKLLENFCEVFRMTQRCIDKYEREEYGETIGQDEIQAIENLIARNKELEEEAIKEKEKNKELRKPKYIMDFKTNKITKLTNDFVSKDKIKELIDKRGNNGYTSLDCIEDIKELLEESH